MIAISSALLLCLGAAYGYRLSPMENLALLEPVPASGSDIHPNYLRFGDLDALPTGIVFGRSQPNLAGALWSKSRMPQSEWQVHLKVRIRGASKTGGDGLAFWYTKDGHAPGPVFGAPDRWTGLGLILDTFDNDSRGNNPAIMGILNDGSLKYDAQHDGEGQYFGGCLRNIRNLSNNIPLYLRITYMQGMFKVELDDANEGQRYVNCFEKAGLKLPAGYYFGLSGATNQLPDTIEVLSMTVHGAEAFPEAQNEPHEAIKEPQQEQQQQQHQQQPPQGVLAATNMDAASLINALDLMLQKQLRTFLPKIIAGHSEESTRKVQSGLETRFSVVEDRLRQINEGLGQLQRTLGAMGDHLHHLDTAHLSDDLHHMSEDLKTRLSSLQGTTGRVEARSEEIRQIIQPKRGLSDRYGNVILFLVAQVILVGIFYGVKAKLDRREKKWM